MQIEPYLFFEGRTEEALKFYQKALGAKVEMMMRNKESPEPPPPGMNAPAEAKKKFNVLAEGGEVKMPLTKTFFSPAFGMLTDRFGVGWMVMVPGQNKP